MSSSMGRMTSHIWNGKSNSCSKPPTRKIKSDWNRDFVDRSLRTRVQRTKRPVWGSTDGYSLRFLLNQEKNTGWWNCQNQTWDFAHFCTKLILRNQKETASKSSNSKGSELGQYRAVSMFSTRWKTLELNWGWCPGGLMTNHDKDRLMKTSLN